MILAQPSVCELFCLLHIGHSWPWRQDHFHNCSCSSTPTHSQAFPHVHPQAHAQSGKTQWAIRNCWSKKNKYCCLCTLFVCFLMDRIPVLRSLPLAVWHPSWGRVTCSLPAWQSTSPSRPAASICLPQTANRLDWKQPTLVAAFVCIFAQKLSVLGRFVLDRQRFDCESEMHLIVRALL